MQELNLHQKLIHDRRKVHRLENIVTHEKDRSFVECAYAYKGIIITYEMKHLIDIRTDMRTQLNVDILLPSEYLSLE
jgi:predicted nucleic acid-binding protein